MSVLEGGWECGWGEAGGWMPLPTRPQRYCDPASLVFHSATKNAWILTKFLMEKERGEKERREKERGQREGVGRRGLVV